MGTASRARPPGEGDRKMHDLKLTIGVAVVSAVASVLTAYITFWKGPLEVKR